MCTYTRESISCTTEKKQHHQIQEVLTGSYQVCLCRLILSYFGFDCRWVKGTIKLTASFYFFVIRQFAGVCVFCSLRGYVGLVSHYLSSPLSLVYLDASCQLMSLAEQVSLSCYFDIFRRSYESSSVLFVCPLLTAQNCNLIRWKLKIAFLGQIKNSLFQMLCSLCPFSPSQHATVLNYTSSVLEFNFILATMIKLLQLRLEL